jgi:hypothetical protein
MDLDARSYRRTSSFEREERMAECIFTGRLVAIQGHKHDDAYYLAVWPMGQRLARTL